MIFAKVDVSVPRHHRFLRIPKDKGVRAAALGVWMTALCYTRAEELDGFVPLEAVESIATEPVIGWLVTVGLLARSEHDGIHGFEVLKYAKHNETKAEIEERKAIDRGRKRKNFRNGPPGDSGGNPPAPTGGFPDSDSDSEISEGERERESAPALGASESRIRPATVNVTADGAFGLAVAAWAEGIGRATGLRFVAPRGGSAELGKLVDAMAAHCPPTEERVDWARRTGEIYGRARKGCALHAHGFLDWLNSGRPDRAAGPGGPGPPDRNPYDGPAVRTERRRRDAELSAAVAEGISPAPIGALLKAVGGKPK